MVESLLELRFDDTKVHGKWFLKAKNNAEQAKACELAFDEMHQHKIDAKKLKSEIEDVSGNV